MPTVPLSDSLYAEAAQIAADRGVTLEAFVSDAVRLRLGEEDGVAGDLFTPEILAEIDVAREEARQDKGLSLQEFRAQREAKSLAWRASRHA